MKLSEDLLSSMVLELKGSYKIQYHAVSSRQTPCMMLLRIRRWQCMITHAAVVAAAKLTDCAPCATACAAAPELHKPACGAGWLKIRGLGFDVEFCGTVALRRSVESCMLTTILAGLVAVKPDSHPLNPDADPHHAGRTARTRRRWRSTSRRHGRGYPCAPR